jgi:very-short-patch-repair endonuclease
MNLNIEDKIIEILGDGKSLKGREIASILSEKYGITVDKSEVNSLLYGKLHGKVEQNNAYQWSLKKFRASIKKEENKTSQTRNTPLAKLIYYYLECISKDMDPGISVFSSSFYNLEYSPVQALPFESADEQKISDHLLGKVKKDRNNYVFKLGYPALIRTFTAKDSKNYFVVEPLFTFLVDTEYALQTGNIRISDEDPSFNQKALESIIGSNSTSELLSETNQLYQELGVHGDPEDRPPLDELFLRLQGIRSEWNWREGIATNSLSRQAISSISIPGVYNLAAIFVTEKSKYTAGLEKDFKDMATLAKDEYGKSILGDWINNSIQSTPIKEDVLVEPIPLNQEQKESILRGLSSPLTVITGPPGTGKSQVVTSLIVNAVYQGQTVLFSSKNNKAVDVVYERVNALSERPVMLRLGSTFQSALSDHLVGLLSAKPSKEDEARYKEAVDIHLKLCNKIGEKRKDQEKLIEIRNLVDQRESKLEDARELLGNEFFYACQELSDDQINQIDSLLHEGISKLRSATKSEQPVLTRLFWGYLRGKRFREVLQILGAIAENVSTLDITWPNSKLEDKNIHYYKKYLDSLAVKVEKAKAIKEYFNLLKRLSQQEDLFSLASKERELSEKIEDNSLELWNYWLQLLPNRMSQHDRKLLGDYITALNLIVAAESSKQPIDRSIWPKYYGFLSKIQHILSCWAVTSLSARGRVPLEAGFFDLVVIDEASQCDIASALPLLYRAKRAVIIGDSKQLTHISSISEVEDIRLLEKHELQDDYLGWSYATTSLFKLASSLCKGEDIVVLKDHHRSHAHIINYSNKYFYDSTLRVATKYQNLNLIPNSQVVRWIDKKGKCSRSNTGSTYNDIECEEVIKELKRIADAGYKGTIGVVTPFRAQYQRIRDKISQNNDLFERLTLREFLCDTVHKFQGDERDVIIFSPVVSDGMSAGAAHFLRKTGNLFNVAITRARAALIVIGDLQASYKSDIVHYRNFVDYYHNLNSDSKELPIDITKDFGPKYPKIPRRTFVSDWEVLLYEKLHKEGIITIPQYEIEQYFLDLALLDGERKLNVEVDGDRYHRNWDGELLRRDQIRNKRLIELGWDVQRFWVYQIRDNMQQCIDKIKTWKMQK